MTTKAKKSEAIEGEIVDSVWDLKKIIIGIVVLIIMFIFGSYLFKFAGNTLGSTATQVLGTSTASSTQQQNAPPLPSKQDIDNVIHNAKNTLSQITSDNVNSSGSAIQNLINQLQELQGKKGALGAFCNLVCSK